jgi:serine/threonine-protein kinase
MKLEAGKVVADRFRLIRLLGQGGMGSVWLAWDTSLDTPCAIKFILDTAAESEEMRSRFEREAKSAAQLHSPNVVQVLDHDICEGTPYIAMEFLDGEDLGQRLKRVGRLSPHQTVAILSQVAKALTKANAAGLVHRDLKPANIFLVPDEDQVLAKVLDFGVAKSNMPVLGDASTRTGVILGTPFYMSPEQARGFKTIDHRSDLWALAVIAFQCVTGRLPFFSESLGDLLFQIGTDPLPIPSTLAPDLPPAFDAWWLRAAMRDPAQRFQTARELVDALTLAFGLAPPPRALWPAPEATLVAASSVPAVTPLPPTLVETPSTFASVSSASVVKKPRRGGARLLVGLAGAAVVSGGLIYIIASRGGSPPIMASSNTSAVVWELPAAVPLTSEELAPPSAVTASKAASPTASPSIAAPAPALGKPWPTKAGRRGKDGGAPPARAHIPADGI